MQFFDSHCHLDDRSYEKDLDRVVDRAKEAGIREAMTVAIDLPTALRALGIAETYDDIYASVGIHPHRASSCSNDIIDRLTVLSKNPLVRAWGETGLDFNRMYSPKNIQEKWFVRQVQAAADRQLPLILHERDTSGRLLEMLMSWPDQNRRGVVHCFSGSAPELHAYLDMGFYIGITGILTLRKRGAELRSLAGYIPMERLLIETDAPYLTPSPHKNRTRRNEPAFVTAVLFKLAEIRRMAPEKLAHITTNNARRLFGIPTPTQS